MMAAIIAGLRAELRKALAAIAQNAAMEIQRRQQVAIPAHGGRSTCKDDGGDEEAQHPTAPFTSGVPSPAC